MTNATLPSSLKQINDDAFFGCSTLIKVINNSSLVLDFGSNDHGGVAYYAKVIVDKNGNLNPTYEYVKKINAEIKEFSPTFRNFSSVCSKYRG